MWSQSLIVFSVLTLTFASRGGGHGGRSGGYGGGGGSYGRGGGSGGQSHTYPQSHGYSGSSSTGSHTYPHTTGLSGDSSSHVQKTYNQQHNVNYGHKTEVHNHYHYSPPQQINYGSSYHPVYHAAPPVYVYEYRDSGSRFDNLLAGLALYNLGRMSANNHHYNPNREYRSSTGEVCKLGISKQNQEYEETRIDCKLMSSFIWDAENNSENTKQQVVSTNTVTTTTVNVTSNSNGTNVGGASHNSKVITTVTAQNSTLVDALHVKGPSINVTPGMNCFMIRISRDSSILKRKVECGLLQAYAQNSLRHNGSGRTPASMVLPLLTLIIPLIDITSQIFCNDT